MMIKHLRSLTILITLALALGAGCNPKNTRVPEQGTSSGNNPIQQANTQPSMTITTPQAMPVFSPEEVSAHITTKDCWVSIQEKVYDFSPILSRFSEKNSFTEQCGKDATERFNQVSNKPDERTAAALKLLPEYEIGTLAK